MAFLPPLGTQTCRLLLAVLMRPFLPIPSSAKAELNLLFHSTSIHYFTSLFMPAIQQSWNLRHGEKLKLLFSLCKSNCNSADSSSLRQVQTMLACTWKYSQPLQMLICIFTQFDGRRETRRLSLSSSSLSSSSWGICQISRRCSDLS